jgi:hypothetical protein
MIPPKSIKGLDIPKFVVFKAGIKIRSMNFIDDLQVKTDGINLPQAVLKKISKRVMIGIRMD